MWWGIYFLFIIKFLSYHLSQMYKFLFGVLLIILWVFFGLKESSHSISFHSWVRASHFSAFLFSFFLFSQCLLTNQSLTSHLHYADLSVKAVHFGDGWISTIETKLKEPQMLSFNAHQFPLYSLLNTTHVSNFLLFYYFASST